MVGHVVSGVMDDGGGIVKNDDLLVKHKVQDTCGNALTVVQLWYHGNLGVFYIHQVPVEQYFTHVQ